MCSYGSWPSFIALLALGCMTAATWAADAEKWSNDVTGARITSSLSTSPSPSPSSASLSSQSQTTAAGKAARSYDLETAATNGKFLNLGSLFGYPNYGYGYGSGSGSSGGGYRPSYNQYPGYYPTTGTGYYHGTGSGSGSYYPNSGGYYPNSGGYYPSSGGYYPSTNYYPSGGAGTVGGGGYYTTNNLGGNGGYGGYGGNGGLRQYSGYLNSDYSGQSNRGYGYYSDTDSNGLPLRQRDDYAYDSNRDRDRAYGGGYRGYN